jgi:hypothetical protein
MERRRGMGKKERIEKLRATIAVSIIDLFFDIFIIA